MGNENKLLTVKRWGELHMWPSESGLRHLIFNSKDNGFDKVVRRVAGRVLIDEGAFFLWVEEQNGKG